MANKKSTKKSSGTVGTATVKSKPENVTESETGGVQTLADTPQYLAAYSPKTWINGETIYDTDLNHAEQGIADAQDTADNAQSFAENVQIAVDEVGKEAQAAQSTANSANTAASTAQSTANSAQSTADKAQSTADSALQKATAVEDSALTGINVNGTAASVSNHVANIEIDESTKVYYGVCKTATSTVAKTVSIDDFVLEEGALVVVYFQNGNTAEDITLNVSGTGAKAVLGYFNMGTLVGAVLFAYQDSVYNPDPAINLTYFAEETANDALKKAESVKDSAITGINVNGTAQPVTDNIAELTIDEGGIAYAECNTNADFDVKEVTIGGWKYTDGAVLAILFTKGNTVDGYTDIIVNGNNTHSVAGDCRCPENSLVFFVYSATDSAFIVDAGLTRANEANTEAQVAKSSAESAQSTADSALQKATEVEDTALTGINVNGTVASVSNHVAEIVAGVGETYYGTCASAKSDETKIVTCTEFTGNSNAHIVVQFEKGNTVESPRININDTGAYSIHGDIICGEETFILMVSGRGAYYIDSAFSLATVANTNADDALKKAESVEDSAITSITVNGEDVPVEDNKAEITVSGAEPTYDADTETLIF